MEYWTKLKGLSWGCCPQVSFDQVRNGDIPFFSSYSTNIGPFGHVGIYYNGQCFGQNQYPDNGGFGGPFNLKPLCWLSRPAVVLRPN